MYNRRGVELMEFGAGEYAFWLLTVLLLYPYTAYPLWLVLLGCSRQPTASQKFQPTVSLLIPAHNVAALIESKILNSLALDYPADKLEIVVASDGSTDQTAVNAGRLADGRRVRLLEYSEHTGKIQVMNASVPLLGGEIVVFSDSSAWLDTGAISVLVGHYCDPSVGAVGGAYHFPYGGFDAVYWRFEHRLRVAESALGMTVGLAGALFSIRKSLYPFPPRTTINDDTRIPLRVLRQGFKVLYEPAALAIETRRNSPQMVRWVRTMCGNLQELREILLLVNSGRWLGAAAYLSHRSVRMLGPVALIALAVLTLSLAQAPLYRAIGAAQVVFYALAVIGFFCPRMPHLLQFPCYVCKRQAAVLLALVHAVFGFRRLRWGSDEPCRQVG